MNLRKHTGFLLLSKAIKKDKEGQTQKLVYTLSQKISKEKKTKKTPRTLILTMGVLVLGIGSLVYHYQFDNQGFQAKNLQGIEKKPKQVINKPDFILVRLNDGFWFEINKQNGKYRKVFIDSSYHQVITKPAQ